MKRVRQIEEQVSFVLCQSCFWHATYMKSVGTKCPQCNGRISVQKVRVFVTF